MEEQAAVIEISWGTPLYEQEVALRYEVLRKPLGLSFTPEQLAEEAGQFHFAAMLGGEMIGTLVLKPAGSGTIQMRQVAVLPGLQGMGTGKLLVNHSEQFARAKGFSIMLLHARDTAVPFYSRLGYTLNGPGFVEVTIPHHEMVKTL